MVERSEYRPPQGELLHRDGTVIDNRLSEGRRSMLEGKVVALRAEVRGLERRLEQSREMAEEKDQIQQSLRRAISKEGGVMKKLKGQSRRYWGELTEATARLQRLDRSEVKERKMLVGRITDLTRQVNILDRSAQTLKDYPNHLRDPLTLLGRRRKEEGLEAKIQLKIDELNREIKHVEYELSHLG